MHIFDYDTAPRAMVEMTLKAMLNEGLITKTGGGRSTAYVRID